MVQFRIISFSNMANEATAACGGDPNFAVICSFLHRYGELLGVPDIPFTYLEKYLEDSRSGRLVTLQFTPE